MVFLLSNQNLLDYLINQKIVKQGQSCEQIESKICKNFNLLIHSLDGCSLFVKQEPHDREGNTNKDFLHEWQVYKLIRQYPEISHLRLLLSEAIYFDSNHAVIVFNYLTDYVDLGDFYAQRQISPVAIAASLGATLAEIHRATIDCQDYQEFLAKTDEEEETEPRLDFGDELEEVTPDSFGVLSADGLKFRELYQRYESLGQAISGLNVTCEPCCLIHNDLKLNNVLLHLDWQELLSSADRFSAAPKLTNHVHPVRLIDWEKWTWGDPAADLGTLIASYLKIWLRSLVVQAGIELDLALRLADVPLEAVQPSIGALVQSYLAHFPEILARSPDFLRRVMQFAGLALIESIQAALHYHEPFGNIEICMLQVAKALLCTPLESIETVFGATVSALLQPPVESWCVQPVPETYSQTVQPQTVQQDIKGTQLGYGDHPPIASTQEAILHDLVVNIQIRSDFCIYHPRFTPAQPLAGLGDRLQQLPTDIQSHYLKVQLQNYLYDLYFSGEQALVPADASFLENNAVRGVNVAFYEQLHDSNRGQGYFDPGWQVLRQGQAGTFAVQKDRLTVQIQPDRHLRSQQPPALGDTVAIWLPRNRLETGFYVAVGNAGLLSDTAATVELYFNLTPAAAIALMGNLTHSLNACCIPFLFKVVSDPSEYGRYDSGILQIERQHYDTVRRILQQVYVVPNSGATSPLFSKPLAPGLGLAEEPDGSGGDFGMNRCQLVAEALLAVWQTGEDSWQARLRAICQRFTQQGIDWQRPYLNPRSQDIYTPLD